MGEKAVRTEQPGRQDARDKALIFIHTYKTGGMSLHSIMQRQFPRGSIVDFPGGESLEDLRKNLESLESLAKKKKPGVRYIFGAPFVGMHEYLDRPHVYVTLIRNPVDRVISEYYHTLRGPSGKELVDNNISLDEYARKGMWLGWNAQVHFLVGVPEGPWPEYGPVKLADSDLEKVKENLRRDFIIALTERFDESMVLLKRAFGWRTIDILYLRRYVGRNRPAADKISQETRKLIEQYNQLDMQLYEYAKQMFQERVSQEGPSFEKEVRDFRRLNRYYNFIGFRAFILFLNLLRGKLGISDFSYIVNGYVRSIGKPQR